MAPGRSWGLKCHPLDDGGGQEDPSSEAELADVLVYAVIQGSEPTSD